MEIRVLQIGDRDATSCAYRAAASLPLSVEGFIWRGLGNQGLGSPRLLVWSSDASFGRPRGRHTRLVRFWGARIDARAPRAVRRVCARAAGASFSQPEKSRKGAILGGLLGRVESCAQVRFFLLPNAFAEW